MKGRVIFIVIIFTFMSFSHIYAKQLYLKPGKVLVLVSPEDKRDVRVLVHFNLPEVLSRSGVEIDYAVLVMKARVESADFGQVDVLPVTTDWMGAEVVTWSSPWKKQGGDYTIEHMGRSVAFISDRGENEMRLNVTFTVKAWIDGVMDNYGFIVVPSQDDLKNPSVRYHFNDLNMKLKVNYNIE